MKELSLYILDITMNSVKAGAKNISISLGEYDGIFSFSVEDDGCGMTKEQLERLSDPFFTTRTSGRSDSVFRFSGCLRSRPEDMSK